MKNISQIIDPSSRLSLYVVSFDDWGYDQYDSFLVVACSEEEADKLTPDQDMNYHIGIGLGYDCPKPDQQAVEEYRSACGEGKSIRRLGDSCVDLEWGQVPISSFRAG
jgi:hypothetical protein